MKTFEILLLALTAFLPPIIYAIWIRNTEKYHPEKWKPLIVCFLWGATIAVIASILLEVFFEVPLSLTVEKYSIPFFMAILVAPLVEEFTKPLALNLKSVKKELTEIEDGFIYGAVAGLGFSATENLLYGIGFFSEGLFIFLVLMMMRSFGGCLLHASATAWTGYGYSKTIMKKTKAFRIIPYFILAFIIHSLYNFLLTYKHIGAAVGLFCAFILVAFTIYVVRSRIKKLDVSHP
ncbi:MAG: PrsW family intramembrane metalloprotease [Candidatus Thermoplasmatota archaeon]